MKRISGFTLVELLITLLIASILLAIATPSFSQMVQDNRIISSTNEFIAAINLTRSEAIKRGGRATMCRSQAPFTVCNNGSGSWSDGWIIFNDISNFGEYDEGEVIQFIHQELNDTLSLNGNRYVRDYISYTATGVTKRRSGAFQAGTLELCDARGNAHARSIIINSFGRPRTAKEAKKCQ